MTRGDEMLTRWVTKAREFGHWGVLTRGVSKVSSSYHTHEQRLF